ncbi:MAG: hypothetical protein AAGD40_08275 [Pseudomonadota bacterium]
MRRWKLFFTFLLAMNMVALWGWMVEPQRVGIVELCFAIMGFPATCGVGAHAFGVVLKLTDFWRAFSIAYVPWAIFTTFLVAMSAFEDIAGSALGIVLFTVALGIMIFGQIQLALALIRVGRSTAVAH